jgi:hypothetical protein
MVVLKFSRVKFRYRAVVPKLHETDEVSLFLKTISVQI